jgi:hypothetical protein
MSEQVARKLPLPVMAVTVVAFRQYSEVRRILFKPVAVAVAVVLLARVPMLAVPVELVAVRVASGALPQQALRQSADQAAKERQQLEAPAEPQGALERRATAAQTILVATLVVLAQLALPQLRPEVATVARAVVVKVVRPVPVSVAVAVAVVATVVVAVVVQ